MNETAIFYLKIELRTAQRMAKMFKKSPDYMSKAMGKFFKQKAEGLQTAISILKKYER